MAHVVLLGVRGLMPHALLLPRRLVVVRPLQVVALLLGRALPVVALLAPVGGFDLAGAVPLP